MEALVVTQLRQLIVLPGFNDIRAVWIMDEALQLLTHRNNKSPETSGRIALQLVATANLSILLSDI